MISKEVREPLLKEKANDVHYSRSILLCLKSHFRKRIIFLIVLLYVLYNFILAPSKVSLKYPKIKTTFGIFEGFEHVNKNGSRSHIFLGIPYAEAPVGKLRFEKPISYQRHETIMETKNFAPACFPLHSENEGILSFSEDCLFLNIIKPAKAPTNHKGYPVLIFIHGGGFIAGSAVTYGYKSLSEHFAAYGIISVTIQYRLGPIGFFSTGDDVLTGNIGLWDQAQALKFLHQILPSFGGNLLDIAVWGQSAGAASVHALSLSPHSKSYFKSAIQNSASLFAGWALNENVVNNSLKIAEILNCNDEKSEKILSCMKEKTMEQILDAGKSIIGFNATLRQFAFNPRIDGNFFPQSLEVLMSLPTNISVLFGVNNKEWAKTANAPTHPVLNANGIDDVDRKSFKSNELKKYIDQFIIPGEKKNHAEKKLRDVIYENFVDCNFPKNKNNESWYLNRAVDMVSDLMFVIPVIQQIKSRTLRKQESFLFYEKHNNAFTDGNHPLVSGARHGNENFYIFDQEFNSFQFTKNDEIFQTNLLQGFRSFIFTGVPQSSGIQWPNVGSDGGRHVVLNPNVEIKETFEMERMKIWTQDLTAKVGYDILKQNNLPVFNYTNFI